MKTKYSTPYIYAHRGARTEAADNTRLAFDKALLYRVDGIETDVQLTLDGISVLWHDRFLDKLGFPDKRIDDFTYQQLKQLNFAVYFIPPQQAEGVISLQEFVDQYRSRCKLQIEIKDRNWEDIQRHQIKLQQCLTILKTSKNLDVFISSFNLTCLQYANQLETEIPLVYAVKQSNSVMEVKNTVNENKFLAGVCLPISKLDTEIVAFLRDRYKLIVTYTCNTQQQIQKALKLEVDILITDNPAKAIQMRS
ncbi:MAG: glycerophosphodiester phosphodiesterase [Methylococcaceae bacterium]